MGRDRHTNGHSPISLIFIGAFLVAIPLVAVFVLAPDPVTGLRSAVSRWSGRGEVPLWWGIAFNSVAVLIGLAAVTAGGRRLVVGPPREQVSRRARGLCHRCEYPLHGVPGPNCPECGTPRIFQRIGADES